MSDAANPIKFYTSAEEGSMPCSIRLGSERRKSE